MKGKVRPFAIAARGSGLEPLTPQLRALLTETANHEPFTLSLAVGLIAEKLRGVTVTDADVAAYFTPAQQKLITVQARQIDEFGRLIRIGRSVAEAKRLARTKGDD